MLQEIPKSNWKEPPIVTGSSVIQSQTYRVFYKDGSDNLIVGAACFRALSNLLHNNWRKGIKAIRHYVHGNMVPMHNARVYPHGYAQDQMKLMGYPQFYAQFTADHGGWACYAYDITDFDLPAAVILMGLQFARTGQEQYDTVYACRRMVELGLDPIYASWLSFVVRFEKQMAVMPYFFSGHCPYPSQPWNLAAMPEMRKAFAENVGTSPTLEKNNWYLSGVNRLFIPRNNSFEYEPNPALDIVAPFINGLNELEFVKKVQDGIASLGNSGGECGLRETIERHSGRSVSVSGGLEVPGAGFGEGWANSAGVFGWQEVPAGNQYFNVYWRV